MSKLLQMLINKHTHALLSKLSPKELECFYQERCRFTSTQRIAEADWDKNCWYAKLTATSLEPKFCSVTDGDEETTLP